MMERRRVQRQCYRVHDYFPTIDYRGNIVMSDRRKCPTRHVYDISVREVNFSTNLYERNREVRSRPVSSD